MNHCPCCSSTLCRCIHQGKITWFCSRCRQEMPNFNYLEPSKNYTNISIEQKLSARNKSSADTLHSIYLQQSETI